MLKSLPAALVVLLTAAGAAHAGLITNGGFETTTLASSGQFTTQVTGWTNQATSGYTGYGYNFLIMSGTADTTGFSSFGGNHDLLWGPNDGSNNGLTASSPTGGNYIAADGDSNFHGTISQMVNGLTVGTTYQLSFDWAGAEFYGYNAATTESWNVTFGSDSQNTVTINNDAKGFTGWRTATMSFVASSTSELLSFLAQGTPNGEPPTVLLDNVNLVAQSTAVPEPASFALVGTGLLGLTAVAWRKRRAIA